MYTRSISHLLLGGALFFVSACRNIGEANAGYGMIPDLHRAAEAGDLERVQALLLGNATAVNKQDSNGTTALHWAASIEVAERLIANGADVNAKTDNSNRRTPLHFAALDGYEKVAKALLDHNAYVDEEDGYGRTPLYYAERQGHKKVVKLLQEKKGKAEGKAVAAKTTTELQEEAQRQAQAALEGKL